MNQAQERQFELALGILAVAGIFLLLAGSAIGGETEEVASAVAFGLISIVLWGAFWLFLREKDRLWTWGTTAAGFVMTTLFAYYATRSALITLGACTLVPLIVIAILLGRIPPPPELP